MTEGEGDDFGALNLVFPQHYGFGFGCVALEDRNHLGFILGSDKVIVKFRCVVGIVIGNIFEDRVVFKYFAAFHHTSWGMLGRGKSSVSRPGWKGLGRVVLLPLGQQFGPGAGFFMGSCGVNGLLITFLVGGPEAMQGTVNE